MAIPVLIMGQSGTGKSYSLRNLPSEHTALFNVIGKPLPFRKKLDAAAIRDIPTIQKKALETKRPIVVLDDFGYAVTDLYMRLTYGPEKTRDQYEPYKRIGAEVYNLVNAIQAAKKENAEKIVYIIMHTDMDAQGHIVPATVGKMINEKINIVGMVSICLTSFTDGDTYGFVTNAAPPVKSPPGMFKDQIVDNDLKAVDTAIREYWGMAPISEGSNDAD